MIELLCQIQLLSIILVLYAPQMNIADVYEASILFASTNLKHSLAVI